MKNTESQMLSLNQRLINEAEKEQLNIRNATALYCVTQIQGVM